MSTLTRALSVNWAGGGHSGIELDLAECTFVARYVLLQNRNQGLGLLRAQVNALKISDLDLGIALLLQGAKDEEEVPDADAHLHTVGVVFTIVRGIEQVDFGLSRNGHAGQCSGYGGKKGRDTEWV